MGEGVLKLPVYDVKGIYFVLCPKERELKIDREIQSIFSELGINPTLPIREQKPIPLPDRKALDDIVFDILGLTEDERNEVYWAVCELVKNRLEKARSAWKKDCDYKVERGKIFLQEADYECIQISFNNKRKRDHRIAIYSASKRFKGWSNHISWRRIFWNNAGGRKQPEVLGQPNRWRYLE